MILLADSFIVILKQDSRLELERAPPCVKVTVLAQCRAQPACSFVHSFIALMQKKKQLTQAYLNYLSIDIQHSLAEVHPDGGLHSLGELPGAESVCEAGLPHPGVSYHQHFKGPTAAQQWGHAAQRAGKLEGWLHLPVVHSKRGAKNALGVKRYISNKKKSVSTDAASQSLNRK